MQDKTTAQSYVASGFKRQLGFGERAALLVVDMCNAYFDEASPLNLGSRDAIDSCKELVEAARTSGVPVIWSRVEFAPEEATASVFYRKVGPLSSFDKGNPLGDWLPELTPEGDEHIVTKQSASAFFNTNLEDQLCDLDIDTVVICGVSTSGCVRASAIDACQHNFVPIVVREACADRTLEIHNANLFDVDAKYGDVVSLADVLDYFAQ